MDFRSLKKIHFHKVSFDTFEVEIGRLFTPKPVFSVYGQFA